MASPDPSIRQRRVGAHILRDSLLRVAPTRGDGQGSGLTTVESGGGCVTSPQNYELISAGRNKIRALDGAYNRVFSAFNQF
jgi:hypothetical protein